MDIGFADRTALHFIIEPGFTVEPGYSTWKAKPTRRSPPQPAKNGRSGGPDLKTAGYFHPSCFAGLRSGSPSPTSPETIPNRIELKRQAIFVCPAWRDYGLARPTYGDPS